MLWTNPTATIPSDNSRLLAKPRLAEIDSLRAIQAMFRIMPAVGVCRQVYHAITSSPSLWNDSSQLVAVGPTAGCTFLASS